MGKLVLGLIVLAASLAGQARPIVVGSKNFSESIILGEMVALILEKKFGLTVERKLALGGTKVAFDALQRGDIDVYPDYTGTGYVMILNKEGERDPSKVHAIVDGEFQRLYGITWSPSIGFNNTYALAVRSDDPRFKDVKRLSDLSGREKGLTFGSPHEFMERKDGFVPFSRLYSLEFQQENIKSMSSGLTYDAIHSKQVDLIMAYSTDGRLKAFNLRIIPDDKRFFPPYDAALLSRTKTLEEIPEIKEVFTLMEGLISEEDIIEMNDKVDRLKMEPRIVANNFLVDQRIIPGTIQVSTEGKDFLSFALQKRKYLIKLLKEHLVLSLGALFLATLISVPVGILLTRRPVFGKFVFPVVNTIQTIPSLALLGFFIPLIGIGFAPALLALFLYSLLPLIRNTYIGIQSVDKQYIEASRGIGLTDWQILTRVELPLATPMILGGLRTAAVIVVGTTTIAALVGAGGLGDPIFRGVATVNSNLILLGSVPAALLAIGMDKFIGFLDSLLVSKGIRSGERR